MNCLFRAFALFLSIVLVQGLSESTLHAFAKRDGPEAITVRDEAYPNHSLSVTDGAEALGLDDVKQLSGYLDVDGVNGSTNHFFFWFFESRNDPANDPILLWLTGGPGCSSFFAAFYENGPVYLTDNGTTIKDYDSWNNNASIIYLDQPVGVGYSYATGGNGTVNPEGSNEAAASDVYVFLNLFFKQFPQYGKLPFHITGESYAGHYIPAIAADIITREDNIVNLASVVIGNGITDPLIQYQYYQPMACGQGGYPAVLNSSTCAILEGAIPNCTALIQTAYDQPHNISARLVAQDYCQDVFYGYYEDEGFDTNDVTAPPQLYSKRAVDPISGFLNSKNLTSAIGAKTTWTECSSAVYRAFYYTGDEFTPVQRNVTTILEKGIPVLIYAGDRDFICNWLGNHAWTDQVPWSGHDEYSQKSLQPWSINGTAVGEVKHHDLLTFVRVYNAGHAVPEYVPAVASNLVRTWISGNLAIIT